MTETKPNVNPTGRYTIAKTCEILGINRSTLLRHTKAGHIKPSEGRAPTDLFTQGWR